MFKERFIRLCAEKGMSPSAVCKQIGLSNSVYSKWGENTIPRQTVLIKLSEFFGCTIDYLLGKENMEQIEKPSKENTELPDLMYKFENLSDDKKQEVLAFIEFKLHQQENDSNT